MMRLEAVIIKLIFCVCSSGGQCEEVIRRLVDVLEDDMVEVKKMALKHRYVDDFLKSITNKMEAKLLTTQVMEVLGRIGMKVKGWAFSKEAPPKDMSEDGVSVKMAGVCWYTELDYYMLGISPLYFGKKKRGRLPANVKKFDGKFGVSVKEFVPDQLSRRKVTLIVGPERS